MNFSDFGLLISQYNITLPTVEDAGFNELQIDSLGRLIISGRYFEDSGHVSGDAGLFAMGVRNDLTGFDGVVAAALYDTVTFTADFVGLTGNSISLVFNGIDDVATVVGVWNVANPTNTVSYSGLGTYVPAAGSPVFAGGLNSGILTSDDLDYSPIAVDKYGRVMVVADLDVDFDYVYAEDSAFASGNLGTYVLAVRQDILATDTSLDRDFSSFKVDSKGALYVTLAPQGNAAFVVTDALAAGGDGLIAITAIATPWVTVASLPLPSGTAHIYGFEWSCDQNAQAQIITDNGINVEVYKTNMNSSAEPSVPQFWSDGARIEIAGAAGLVIKLQIKKRSVPGGNAAGSGSMHIRVA